MFTIRPSAPWYSGRERPALYLCAALVRAITAEPDPWCFVGINEVARLTAKQRRAAINQAHRMLTPYYRSVWNLDRSQLEQAVPLQDVQVVAKKWGITVSDLMVAFRKTCAGAVALEKVYGCSSDCNGVYKHAIGGLNALVKQRGIIVPETIALMLVEVVDDPQWVRQIRAKFA